MNSKVQTLIKQLRFIRTKFSPEAAALREALLNKLKIDNKLQWHQILALHELLLFIRAYPDNFQILKSSELLLQQLINVCKHYEKKSPGRFKKYFYGTGIAYSTNSFAVSIDQGKWILNNCIDDIQDVISEELDEQLESLLPFITHPAEKNSLEEDQISTSEWLNYAKGKSKTRLEWLIERCTTFISDPPIRDHLFEKAGPEIDWTIRNPKFSVTGNIRIEPFVFTTAPFGEIKLHSMELEKFDRPQQLHRQKLQDALRIIKSTLAARSRETDPVTYAENVYEVSTPRGFTLLLSTMRVDKKLPLENYTGYVASRNGVPVAYGGGWMFGKRLELGINVFETYRGGDNRGMLHDIIAVYRKISNADKIVIPPYQFGADNEEGLLSGAFWFYYKLGFRPENKSISSIAAKEYKRLTNNKNTKSQLKTLKLFATTPLVLYYSREHKYPEPKDLSLAIIQSSDTNYPAVKSGIKEGIKYSRKLLSVKHSVSQNASKALSDWAPVLKLLYSHSKLDPSTKKMIRAMLMHKNSNELEFSGLFGNNHRLIETIAAVIRAQKKR